MKVRGWVKPSPYNKVSTMTKIENTVAKLRMIGKEIKPLSDNAAIIEKEDSVTAFSLNEDGSINQRQFTRLNPLNAENTIFMAEVDKHFYILDSSLNQLLDLLNEIPSQLIMALYIELINPMYNSRRLIGIDGTPLSEYNAKKIDTWVESRNKLIIATYFMWTLPRLDIIKYDGESYTIKNIDISKYATQDMSIVACKDSVILKSDLKHKLIEIGYDGKIRLSVPDGSYTIDEKSQKLKIRDKFNRIIKENSKLLLLN